MRIDRLPPAERHLAIAPAQLALIAAEVQYAFDNVEEARRRFDAIMQKWPGDAEIMENAVHTIAGESPMRSW